VCLDLKQKASSPMIFFIKCSVIGRSIVRDWQIPIVVSALPALN
jgi:hypothetical protein